MIRDLSHKTSRHGYIPPYIKCPPYAATGLVANPPDYIEVKKDEDIAAMRTACRTARRVLNIARDYIKVRLKFNSFITFNNM